VASFDILALAVAEYSSTIIWSLRNAAEQLLYKSWAITMLPMNKNDNNNSFFIMFFAYRRHE
jgi:hypothetical protein